MLVCAVYSEKGGVGKTSTVNGLAAAAAERGLSVVVVDGDPRATATEELGVDHPSEILTLNDLLYVDPRLATPPDPAEVVSQVIHPCGPEWPATVRVIPAERNLANRETDAAPTEGRLRRALRGLVDVDLVLEDLPPRAGGKLVTGLLTAATTALIPSTLQVDGYRGVEHAKRTLALIRQSLAAELGYTGIVRTIVPRNPDRRAIHAEIDRALADTYPGEVLDVVIHAYSVREEARAAAVPITSAPGREARILARAYGALLDHVLSGASRG